ncbi:type IV pilin [Salinirussus salinus]|uniref:type IV pilin n=1 Tax=Salinirussus salinus TaxID=1198300 RepID=UPI0013571A79|nr:type IV pilin [Salinirussus salinus]
MVGSGGARASGAGRRAQSETIGVLLLTAVVVVLVSVVGAGVIANVSSQAQAGEVAARADVTITSDNVTVTHGGGDTLADSTVQVILRNGSDESRYELSDVAPADRTGDGDGRFEPGERAVLSHSLTGTVSVLVVDIERGTVLGRGEASDVSDTTPGPPEFRVRIDNTDSPVAEGETLTVRPTVTNHGDRQGTREVNLTIDGTEVDTQSLTLGAGRSEQIELTWPTAKGDNGTYTTTVASGDDSDSAPVRVLELAVFDVTIDGTNSPIQEGDNLTTNTTVENTGENPDSQAIELNIDGIGEPFDAERVGLYGGNSTTFTLENITEVGDAGIYTVVIASDDRNDSASFIINGIPTNFTSTQVDDTSPNSGSPAEFNISYATNNTAFKNVTVVVERQNGGGRQEFNSTLQTDFFKYTDENNQKSDYDITYRIYNFDGTVEDEVIETETSGQGGGPPGQGGDPPGQGGDPPGQGGDPPGQSQ